MTNISEILLNYQKNFFQNNKKRKIWISSRQIGKSFTIAAILCYKCLLKKNGLSLCISTGSRAASEIIRKCEQFAQAIKILSNNKIDYTSSFDQIKFNNGSRVLSLPSSTDGSNLRGFTAQVVCIDEAGFIPHLDNILQAINPTLSRDPNAELIFTSTPSGKNAYFYNLIQDNKDNENWYIQQTTIYDAINDGLKVDINSLKTLCPDPDVFKQEYECIFSDVYGQMIDINLLDYYNNDIKSQDGIFFSADIGRTHDKTSIVISKVIKDNIYIDDIITLNKCEYQKQLDIFKNLNEKYKFNSGYIDQGGIGSAVAEFTNKNISSKIKGFNFTSVNKTPAYENVRDKIFQRKLHFNIKFKQLIENDFRNVSRIVNEVGQVKFIAGSNDSGHSDFVSSLVLNLQAIKDNPINSTLPITFSRQSHFGSFTSRF